MDIGFRIRQVRKEKNITLVELSKSTDVAQATLSRIETGDMTGTLECHSKVANSLGMSLSELYEGIDNRSAKTKITKNGTAELLSKSTDQIRSEILTSKALKKKLLPIKTTLKPNSKSEPEKAEKATEKFVYCTEGQITVYLNNEGHDLETEESIYFDGSLPHSFENKTAKVAKLISVTSPPA